MSVPPNAGGPNPWGPPPAGTSWYPPPGPPPRQAGTNGFAVASLILGIFGFIGIGVVLSVIFGCVGLSQIKRTGQGGRGLAIAGLVLSGLWVLGFVALIVVAVAVGPTTTSAGAAGTASGTPGSVADSGRVAATDLRVGQCVNGVKDTTRLLSLPAAACAAPHEGEVYAVFDLPAGPYPGQDAIDAEAQDRCNAELSAYAPSATRDPQVGIFFVYPFERNWDAGDRQVACIAIAESGTRTGSIRGN